MAARAGRRAAGASQDAASLSFASPTGLYSSGELLSPTSATVFPTAGGTAIGGVGGSQFTFNSNISLSSPSSAQGQTAIASGQKGAGSSEIDSALGVGDHWSRGAPTPAANASLTPLLGGGSAVGKDDDMAFLLGDEAPAAPTSGRRGGVTSVPEGGSASAGRRGGGYASSSSTTPTPQSAGLGLSQGFGQKDRGSAGGGGGGELDFLFGDDGGGNRSGSSPSGGTGPATSPGLVSLSGAGVIGLASNSSQGRGQSVQQPGGGGRQRSTVVSFIGEHSRDPLGATLGPPSFAMGRRSGGVTPASEGGGDSFLYEDDFVDETASAASRKTQATTHGGEAMRGLDGSQSTLGGHVGRQGADEDDLDSLFGGRSTSVTTPAAAPQRGPSPSASGSARQTTPSTTHPPLSPTSTPSPSAGGVGVSSEAVKALEKELESLREAVATKKPKTLEEQQDELLAELHEVEALLLKQTLKTNSAEHEQKRSRENNSVSESSKKVELLRARGSVDVKMREAKAYSERRIAEAKSKGTKEAAELVSTQTTMLTERNERIIRDLTADIKLAKVELDKLETQKQLLLKNGSFEPAAGQTTSLGAARSYNSNSKAVYVRLLDAKTVDEKVDVALSLLMDQHKEINDALETKVCNYIHLESSALASESWEERHRVFVKESNNRREAFSLFKTELLDKASSFCASRYEGRRTDICSIQDLVKRNIEEVRERTIAVTRRVEEDCRAQFDELSATYRSRYRQALDTKILQQKAVFAEDERAYAAQAQEASSRHQLTRRLTEKLHTEEIETVRTVLAREVERNEALKLVTSAGGTHFLGGSDGMRPLSFSLSNRTERAVSSAASMGILTGRGYDAETVDHKKRLGELLNLIDKEIERQTNRNRAFKSVSAANADLGTASVSSTSDMNLVGLTSDEAQLVTLFTDKQAVLGAVHTTVKDQLSQLEVSREALGSLVEGFEIKISTLMRELHDARLGQQSQLSKAEAIRSQWEREHRAMLSHKNVDCSAFLSSADAQARGEMRDVYGLYPALGIALQLATTVRNAAVTQQERYQSFYEKRGLMLQTQRQGDVAAAEDNAALQQAWEKVLTSVLALNEGTKGLTERQVAVLSEQAKLGVERELLAHERRSLAQKTEDLGKATATVETEYTALKAQGSDIAGEARRLEKEQDAANRELRTLVVLQGDLRHQQAAHYAQASRLEKMKQRLLGVWGSDGFSSSNRSSSAQGRRGSQRGAFAGGTDGFSGLLEVATSAGSEERSSPSGTGGGVGAYGRTQTYPATDAESTSMITLSTSEDGRGGAGSGSGSGNGERESRSAPTRVLREVGDPYNYLINSTLHNHHSANQQREGDAYMYTYGRGSGGGDDRREDKENYHRSEPYHSSSANENAHPRGEHTYTYKTMSFQAGLNAREVVAGGTSASTRTPTTTSISKASNAPSAPPSSADGMVPAALNSRSADRQAEVRVSEASQRGHQTGAVGAARGSMSAGLAYADEEDSDEGDSDDKTDAYSEQAHSRNVYSPSAAATDEVGERGGGRSKRGAASFANASVFTQLRQISPSLQTSTAGSLNESIA